MIRAWQPSGKKMNCGFFARLDSARSKRRRTARKLPRAVLRPGLRGRDRPARARARCRPQPPRLWHVRRSLSPCLHRLAGLQFLRRPFRHGRRPVSRSDALGDARDRGARDPNLRRRTRRERRFRRRVRDPPVADGRALPPLVCPRALARPLIGRYAWQYSVAIGVWLVSLVFDSPTRYVLWGIAIAWELSIPPRAPQVLGGDTGSRESRARAPCAIHDHRPRRDDCRRCSGNFGPGVGPLGGGRRAGIPRCLGRLVDLFRKWQRGRAAALPDVDRRLRVRAYTTAAGIDGGQCGHLPGNRAVVGRWTWCWGSPGARRRRRRLPRLRHRRTSGQGPRCLGRCAAIADRSSHGACRPRARRGCWTRSCSWPQRRAFSSALSSSSFGRQNANSRRARSELDAVPGSSVGVLTGMRALDDHVDEQAKRAPDVELSFVSEEGAGIRVRRRLTADAADHR
jgi:hypothetical protein